MNMVNAEIIKRLKTAKEMYDKDTKPGSDRNGGMCHYMKAAFGDGLPIRYNKLITIIPEFNPQFLGGHVKQEDVARLTFWWPVDVKSYRIAAFEKLINCYMDRMKMNIVLVRAREIFINHPEYWGMCHCIGLAYEGREKGWTDYGCPGRATELIPEFNREFLGAPKDRSGKAYWWEPDSEAGHNARIAAFDKLIKHYDGRQVKTAEELT